MSVGSFYKKKMITQGGHKANIVDYFIIKELNLKPLQCRVSLESFTYIHLFWFFKIKFWLCNK